MPIANVAALGTTRKMLGFSRNTVEFEGETVADLLRQLPTQDGSLPLRQPGVRRKIAARLCDRRGWIESENRSTGQATARGRTSRHDGDPSSPGWRLTDITL